MVNKTGWTNTTYLYRLLTCVIANISIGSTTWLWSESFELTEFMLTEGLLMLAIILLLKSISFFHKDQSRRFQTHKITLHVFGKL